MITTALLALALGPAPVYVQPVSSDDDPGTRSLQDQLMLRLLEEGYPLAPSAEHATRTLRVQPTPDGLHVEAVGEDSRAFDIATGPVLPLEAVHRAMEALDEITPRAQPDTVAPPRFAVFVDAPPGSTSPEAIRRAVVHALLAHHGMVVPLDAAPDGVVCAEGVGDDLALSRGAHVGDCGHTSHVVEMVAEPEQTERTPDATALQQTLQTLMTTEPEPSTAQAVEPRTSPRPTPMPTGVRTDRDPEPKGRGPALRIGARTGVYGRVVDADAAVGTSLRVGREPGPGGLLDVMMIPSASPNISIIDTNISGGFGWMWSVSKVVALQLQGLVGVQIHRYRQRGGDPGHRAEWTAEIPLGMSLRLAEGLRLDITLRGGRTGRPREHRVDDVVVWERSAWRVGASVGLSYGWNWGGRPR